MNPFDLRGPEFLAFYVAFAALVIWAMVLHRRASERGEMPQIPTRDPYLLAYLRGGRDHAVLVATVSLIERGLLRRTGSTLQAADEIADQPASDLERRVLGHFKVAGEAKSLFKEFDSATDGYRQTLEDAGALPDEATRTQRGLRYVVVAATLGGVVATRLLFAFERGHTNVLFLIALAVASLITAHRLGFPHRTARGDALLVDLGQVFGFLRERDARELSAPMYTPSELATAGAVFGVAALTLPYAKELFPKAASGSGGSCGSGCGSCGGCGGCGGCGA